LEITIEALIVKILNQEVIFMPMGSDVAVSQKIWPHALVAQYHHGCAKIGNIESHGSLWKLIHRKDNHVGFRVIMQASVSTANSSIFWFVMNGLINACCDRK
jgi:hypothetical protein